MLVVDGDRPESKASRNIPDEQPTDHARIVDGDDTSRQLIYQVVEVEDAGHHHQSDQFYADAEQQQCVTINADQPRAKLLNSRGSYRWTSSVSTYDGGRWRCQKGAHENNKSEQAGLCASLLEMKIHTSSSLMRAFISAIFGYTAFEQKKCRKAPFRRPEKLGTAVVTFGFRSI